MLRPHCIRILCYLSWVVRGKPLRLAWALTRHRQTYPLPPGGQFELQTT